MTMMSSGAKAERSSNRCIGMGSPAPASGRPVQIIEPKFLVDSFGFVRHVKPRLCQLEQDHSVAGRLGLLGLPHAHFGLSR
jgi:hypothetical protein